MTKIYFECPDCGDKWFYYLDELDNCIIEGNEIKIKLADYELKCNQCEGIANVE